MLKSSKDLFINSTLPYDSFKIIETNTDGSCCYNSIYKLLLLNNKINNKITTKHIQNNAVKWLEENRNLYLNNFNMTVEEYVLFNHNLDSFEQYLKYYKIYSGNNKNILIDRYGGIPEIIALSNIYNININIYTGKTYRKHKIIKGAIINNKPRKDLRFQLLLNITPLYKSNNINEYNIFYYETKNYKHFYALDII